MTRLLNHLARPSFGIRGAFFGVESAMRSSTGCRKEFEMGSITRVTLLSVLIMVVHAYGQDIHYNYDRGANFGSYRTYQWVDIPGGRVDDQFIDRDIKRAIDEQLAQKGLTRVEKDADLY